MKRIFLGLAIHNHQPIGNFPWVFEEAYRQAYQPMVSALERYPDVHLSLHYSGCLIDWLSTNHPEFIAQLVTLARRGQVEIMSGGYYEPILPAIPDRDKRGQIEKMNGWVESTFGHRPTGMWLAERVWEPGLPQPIAASGIEWTVVDDTHFKMVGLNDQDLFGYYVTEEQGRMLRVFGTSKHLRYVIPWGRIGEVIDYLRSEATEDGVKIAVMGDDGEKFGNWPGTFEYCWKKGWVERLFRALQRNADWLRSITLGEYVRAYPALGRIYLPTASYAEMMEWALPAEESYLFGKLTHELDEEGCQDITKFMRGGLWRNFLVKYPEINSLHKKMLWVHDKVWGGNSQSDVTPEQPTSAADIVRPDPEALDELWKAQCNCPYWHGVFGGSYMTDIRAELYRHLIAAENIVDRAVHGVTPWSRWALADFNCDSRRQLLVETDRLNVYFDLANGGRLFEWDWRPGNYNLLSTIARRPEAYHLVLKEHAAQAAGTSGDGGAAKNIHQTVRAKEPDLDKRLWYDWYERRVMIDHFLHPGTTLDSFSQSTYGEQGDFVNQPYECHVEETDGQLKITLGRDGHVWIGTDWLPLRVEKIIEVVAGSDHLVARYTVTNQSENGAEIWFGVESNFNLLGGGGNDAARYRIPGVNLENDHLDSIGENLGLKSVSLSNQWLGLNVMIEASEPATLWRFPFETIGNSGAGFERVYQSSCLLWHWKRWLAPGQSWNFDLRYCCSRVETVL